MTSKRPGGRAFARLRCGAEVIGPMRICAMLSQSLTIPRHCSHSGVATRDDWPLLESTRVLGFDRRLDSRDVAPGCRASQLRHRDLLGSVAVQHLHFTIVCSRRFPLMV